MFASTISMLTSSTTALAGSRIAPCSKMAPLGRTEAGGGEAPAGRRFVLLEKVRAPVSWDAGHVFWVWRCEREPPRGSASGEPS